MRNLPFFKIIFLIIILLGSGNLAFAATANLSWNANIESDLAGYKIYYGTSPRTGGCPPGGYPINISVGNVTSYALSGLTDGQTYYFSIIAYDTSNNESCFSSEVSKIIPLPPSTVTNVVFIPTVEGLTNLSGLNFNFIVFNVASTTEVVQFSGQADASNEVGLPSITLNPGIYDLLTSTSGWLKKKMLAVNIVSNAVINLPSLPAGDLNSDNVINSLDWSLMSPKWFSSDPVADINKDNIVNTIDFSFLNKNWALVGD